MSISGQHRQADGFVNNRLVGSASDPGALNADSLLVALEADLGDVTLNYNFDFDDRRGSPAYFQIIAAAPDVINYFSQSPNFGGPEFLIGRNRLQNV
jgi:iron complex outermembrane receptor protein